VPPAIPTMIPGMNPGGSSNLVPTTGTAQTPAIGGQSNPLLPTYPAGSAAPNLQFPANTGGGDPNQLLTALQGLNPGAPLGGAGSQWTHTLTGAFHKAGFPSPIAGVLANFLAGGAGFNPDVAKSLLAALQPEIQRGQANIMEQFGSMGLRDSSPAAIGLADYSSRAVLNEGEILSQLYEQSVQNYMNVLLAGRVPENKQGGVGSMLGGLMQGAGSLMGGLSDLGIGIGGGGAAASSGAATVGEMAIAGLI